MEDGIGAKHHDPHSLAGMHGQEYRSDVPDVPRRRVSKRKEPKIGDVAALARVSIGTVSNVMTSRRWVHPNLVERVREAMQQLGYVRHAGASQLRSRRTTVIGAIVPDLPDTFCATFVARVEELARASGYRTLVAGSGEDPEEELAQVQALATWRPAGVLLIPTDDQFRGVQFLASAGIPVVAVDRVIDDMSVDSIGIDNAAASGQGAAHLAALGHKHVLVISSLLSHNVRERVAGARSALAGNTLVEVIEVVKGLEAVVGAVVRRLSRPPLPTAIMAVTHQATLASVHALQRCGLVVPREISLVGFDDNQWMPVMNPALTAVRQPVEALAVGAWQQLAARLRGDRAPPVRIRLAGTLELRNSAGPPRTRAGASPRALARNADR